jgi:outer membrane protein assembly factor BamA
MLRKKKKNTCIIALLLCSLYLSAQQTNPVAITDSTAALHSGTAVIVGEIVFTGNKKTKDFIILREIPFRPGEAYQLEDLVKKFEVARRQLMNTALFNSVIVAAKKIEENKIDVLVEVHERWYLFPLPFFKTVDRNLNQWVVEHKASLDRINYGAKLSYYNATGRNDKLRLSLMNGYTKQLSFGYDRPYFDKKLKWGMKFAFATGKNREVNYTTVNDKQVFFKDENKYVRHFTSANAELTYRRAIKTRHSIGIGYINERVSDTVVQLNQKYFQYDQNRISFPVIYYNMIYLDLDFIPYPTKGYAAEVSVSKSGFNKSQNEWGLTVKGLAYWPVLSESFFNLNAYGRIKLPFKQPYFNQRLLGYGDAFMQGFEYNVIDGVAGGYLKASLVNELLNFSIRAPAIKKGTEATKIPVRIFGKIFGNTGYVYNPEPGENGLSNKMLFAGGIGLDILAFYNITFKLEWTFNSLGQNGLFLHRKSTF